MNSAKEILHELKKFYSKKNIEGMRRFAIPGDIGISVYELRKIGKKIGKNHGLAFDLWKTNVHEARLLACFVADPDKLTEEQADKLAEDFRSWDLCDQCCSNLIDKTDFAYKKIRDWAKSDKEFVKRAGFVLIASLAVHDKEASDKKFINYFPLIKKHSTDERNFVRKAVNWALRGIGKRNSNLNKEAVSFAKELAKSEDKTARWIAKNALRELEKKKF